MRSRDSPGRSATSGGNTSLPPASASIAAAGCSVTVRSIQALQLDLRRLTVALCKAVGEDAVGESVKRFLGGASVAADPRHQQPQGPDPQQQSQGLASAVVRCLLPSDGPARGALEELLGCVLKVATQPVRDQLQTAPVLPAIPATTPKNSSTHHRFDPNGLAVPLSPNDSVRTRTRHGSVASAAGSATGVHLLGFAAHSIRDFNASTASLLHREPAPETQVATVRAEGCADKASFDDHDELMDDGFMVNQYLIIDKIGAGRQGEVFIAEDTVTGEARAIKVVKRPAGFKRLAEGSAGATAGRGIAAARNRQAAQLKQEVSALRQCRHKNIVALHEVIDDPSDDRLYLVLDYVDRGPIAAIEPDGTCATTFNIIELTRYARQLCAGLVYLHSHGIVHRDIKPDNILHDRDGNVYWTDFGMAELFDTADSSNGTSGSLSGSASARGRVWGTRGTVAFMAPELFSATESQGGTPGEAVDVWALGVTFYALLFGRLPWDLQSSGMRGVVDQVCAFRPERIPDVPVPTFGNGSSSSTKVSSSGPPVGPRFQVERPTPRSMAATHGPIDSHDALLSTGTSEVTPLVVAASGAIFPTVSGDEPLALLPLPAPLQDFSAAASLMDEGSTPRETARTSFGSGADDRPSATLQTVAGMWHALLGDMLRVDPGKRITTFSMRKRVRAIVDVLEACGDVAGAFDVSMMASPGITSMW